MVVAGRALGRTAKVVVTVEFAAVTVTCGLFDCFQR
jgi:hypothetical protein